MILGQSRILAIACTAALASAQTFDDLNTVRNPPTPFAELVQFQVGMMGSKAREKVPAIGLDDELALDGHVYYHTEGFGGPEGGLDAYAGRDGIIASVRDGKVVGGENVTRLELKTRLFPFWREGYYQGDNFVPTGQYEGRDWEVYLGFGREASPGLFIETGVFYHDYDFSPSRATDPSSYTIPEDYAAYGIRLILEQNAIQFDRRLGRPTAGFLATVIGEREWNDSNDPFGSTSFTTRLPSAFWRARARVEVYWPQAEGMTWEIHAKGSITDEKDRVYNYEAGKPQGDQWIDARLRLRFDLGESFELTPFVHGQYIRILDGTGFGSDTEYFFGGGAEVWMHFSQTVSLTAWYSYLDNESRPSVSIKEDIRGEHMFFAGMVLRFASGRR